MLHKTNEGLPVELLSSLKGGTISGSPALRAVLGPEETLKTSFNEMIAAQFKDFASLV